jgi:hypothetical protein
VPDAPQRDHHRIVRTDATADTRASAAVQSDGLDRRWHRRDIDLHVQRYVLVFHFTHFTLQPQAMTSHNDQSCKPTAKRAAVSDSYTRNQGR